MRGGVDYKNNRERVWTVEGEDSHMSTTYLLLFWNIGLAMSSVDHKNGVNTYCVDTYWIDTYYCVDTYWISLYLKWCRWSLMIQRSSDQSSLAIESLICVPRSIKCFNHIHASLVIDVHFRVLQTLLTLWRLVGDHMHHHMWSIYKNKSQNYRTLSSRFSTNSKVLI